MKIIISTDSIKYPVTGIARYALELIKNLSSMQDVSSLRFMRGIKIYNELPEIPTNIITSNSRIKSLLRDSQFASDVYRLIVPSLKGRALSSYKDYVFHSPNYFIPKGHHKSCATFHDLSIFRYPEYHPKGRVHLMKKELLSSVRLAKVLITDSEYTKKEVSEYFDFDLARIIVAPLASSGDFYPRNESECKNILSQYGLNYRQFSFFAGTIEPRKNIKNILLAYQNLPKHVSTKFPLVISGYKGWESSDLHKLFEAGEQQGWVKYLGYVSQEALSVLYSSCRGFIFPSRYEGFGLPVLEAMAAGAPVITSNVSSLPEVAGDAALLVDPDDVDAITKNIHSVLLDDVLCDQLIKRGFMQNEKFSWQRCARETFKAYQLVDACE